MRIPLALPRHPLLRLLLLAAGGLVLIGLMFFGLLAGIAVVAAGAVVLLMRRLLPRRVPRAAPGDVIEGEFRVVESAPARKNRIADGAGAS